MNSSIKNIIFDLGNVLLDLDIIAARENMERLLQIPYDSYHESMPECFHQFEKGTISEKDFIRELQLISNNKFSEFEFKNAWNSMLLDFPAHRMELLYKLRKNYTLYLFSNTNETHLECLEQKMGTARFDQFEKLFSKCYYSSRIGYRKPDIAAFHFILKDSGIVPTETIFIDDGRMHVEGARNAGIKAFQHNPQQDISVVLKKLELI